MASRLRPLRVLIPVGVLSGSAVALRATRPSEDSTSEEGTPDSETLSTRLATQLEGEVPAFELLLRLQLPGQLFQTEREGRERVGHRS